MNKTISRVALAFLSRFWFLFPDRVQISLWFYFTMGKKLDLDNPSTMNEKLQWLKLYFRKPEFTDMVDKVKVKQIVSDRIGESYVARLLGVWDHFDDIDFSLLPDSFVLKTNHSGGNTGVIIVKDKTKLDLAAARRKMERSLKSDIYNVYREWPYKNVEKKIFAEEYLGDDLIDYKFYCFDGNADCVLLCIDRQKGDPKFYFFDKDWKLCRYNKRGLDAPEGFTLPKPECMNRMFNLASELSKGFPYLRMDFFEVNGRIYFGEYTFFPASGYDYNRLPEFDHMFGDKIVLPACGVETK